MLSVRRIACKQVFGKRFSGFSPRVNLKSINEQVKASSYAVRGPIVTRSMEIAKIIKSQKNDFPFNEIISCNIGNPHSLEQPPLSYIRDVLSLVMNPSLKTKATFPEDVLQRAQKYLVGIHSVGAYSESQGIFTVRQEVADFITERDGYPANPADIFLTNGASDGVRLCMQTIVRDPLSGFKDGVMTPIPQYPLYSALITLLNGNFVPYHLNEEEQWGCTPETLEKALEDANEKGITVRALVVINPGNPTGQIMPKSVMKEIVQWCRKHQICLMADEVYQENIWTDHTGFHSFRQVAYELDAFNESPEHYNAALKEERVYPHATDTHIPSLQLISFHSISKGFLGECGLRGGYFELLGFPEEVKAEIYKLASISLCSNTIGQIATGLMVRPPVAGDASYDTYIKERDTILTSLNKRAQRMKDALNSLEGVSCTNISGALYAFPTIDIPQKAIDYAHSQGMEADAFYCMNLLETTGIVVVPGSGFGQVKGTYHFRTTILPPEDKLDSVIQKLTTFHQNFLNKYK